MHPDGTAHGGSAILIKSRVHHYEGTHFCTQQIQSTNIVIEDWVGELQISAIYSPPKHSLKKEDYELFFKTLGSRFLAGGDYNAKHTHWGSRLISPKGRQLLYAIESLNFNVISTGEPTYWPTDTNKTPDLIDFFVTKGLSNSNVTCKSCFELSSDHSPVILKLSRIGKQILPPCHLHNSKTNWALFQQTVQDQLNMNICLKTEDDIIEAVEHFNQCIQKASWISTPSIKCKNKTKFPKSITDFITLKREARKTWQRTRCPNDKKYFNLLCKQLKEILSDFKNSNVEKHLESLSPTASTDYSLWKATRSMSKSVLSQPPIRKADNSWAKTDIEKAETFANHLEKVFAPNISMPPDYIMSKVSSSLKETYQLDLPIKKFSKSEVIRTIKSLKPKKTPGYDLITAKILNELPDEGFYFLTCVFNAVLRLSYVPPQWKVAQIKMVVKPGKPPEDVKSYRPISLLPIPSKVLELLFLNRLAPIIEERRLIPDHQFGFRKGHGTIEQVHRVVNCINKALDEDKFCTAIFLDISQAFDKVWHDGLLFKLREVLPINYYIFLKSYLSDR